MANGHGGARPGAGQKKKPLAEKIQDGNPGKRKMAVLQFPDISGPAGETMPKPKDFLASKQKDGGSTVAVEVYESTWQWLAARNCAQLIPPQMLEQYAQTVGRWVQCEEAISAYGFLSKHPTTSAPIPSPFVAMSQAFMKQANNLWLTIFQTVKENCAAPFDDKSPQDTVMERLLSARRGK